MSIDRVATASQTGYFLAQIENAGSALDTTQQQIASGVKSTTYAGFGNQTQVLTATLAADARNSVMLVGYCGSRTRSLATVFSALS